MYGIRRARGSFNFELAPGDIEGWPMMRNENRPHRVLTFLLGFMVLALGSGPARAQMGMGWGWGGFGFSNVPSPTNFLHQHALTRAAAGMQARPSHSPYRNNPNSYINRIRD